jgi:hypothetical protein
MAFEFIITTILVIAPLEAPSLVEYVFRGSDTDYTGSYDDQKGAVDLHDGPIVHECSQYGLERDRLGICNSTITT